jgi:hypothetical protein
MYKCGWHGCEKAYGTLNHLNAHVTMQSHGSKRTPEGEFTSIFLSHRDLELLSWSVANGWIGVSAGSFALVSYTRFRGAAVVPHRRGG